METRLKIIWDGDAPGLAQHRLSLAEFGPALTRLLSAMRRIASGIVTQAQEGDTGLRGGRLAKLASQLDLEVTAVEEGSLGLVMACVLRLAAGQNAELFNNLADQTCTEFVSAVEQESAGQPRNGMVREYLRSLPPGVTSQSYTVQRSDGQGRTVRIGPMALAKLAADAPGLDEVIASIVGVGFEPGRLEVRLLESKSKRPLSCIATPALVERAIGLRSQSVRALIVTSGNKVRLLRLRSTDDSEQAVPSTTREALLWHRWDELLRRFAQ
jgi:hypothetical protein